MQVRGQDGSVFQCGMSQFPECGMNLCRTWAFELIAKGQLVSQFPECGMNLCRTPASSEFLLGAPGLNSLNAG